LGGRKGIPPVKKLSGGVLAWLSVWKRDADLHIAQLMLLTVSCFSKIQTGCTFLVSAHLGSPGKRAVKRVCVNGCVGISYPPGPQQQTPHTLLRQANGAWTDEHRTVSQTLLIYSVDSTNKEQENFAMQQ